jgi:hypothetical protein
VQLVWHNHYSNGIVSHLATQKGSFWLKDVMKLNDRFRGIASANTGRGDTVLLWEDVWNGHFLMHELPQLYSFVKQKKSSLTQFMLNPDIHHNFHTPLSEQAMQ